MQAQLNKMEVCPKFSELNKFYPIELMLFSQVIIIMFIVAKMKVGQHELKRQCVLEPTDLRKVQTILLRSCDEEWFISLLGEKSVVKKQRIPPA